MFLHCGPEHEQGDNDDLSFEIDEAGSLVYRDNSTFFLCLPDDPFGLGEMNYVLLPGVIDSDRPENQTVEAGRCEVVSITASTCHGAFMGDGDDGDDEEQDGTDEQNAPGESESSDSGSDDPDESSAPANVFGSIWILSMAVATAVLV
jgi:hypothetical protein